LSAIINHTLTRGKLFQMRRSGRVGDLFATGGDEAS
jgi:hypothetical protein